MLDQLENETLFINEEVINEQEITLEENEQNIELQIESILNSKEILYEIIESKKHYLN